MYEIQKTMIITYDCKSGVFSYPVDWEKFCTKLDGRSLWKVLEEEGMASKYAARDIESRVLRAASATEPQAEFTEYTLKLDGRHTRRYGIGVILAVPGTVVSITISEIRAENEISKIDHISECDELTGLWNGNAFCHRVEKILEKDQEGVAAGNYAVLHFDVLRFKAINDIFGTDEGNRLLKHIASAIRETMKEEDVAARRDADRFVIFTHTCGKELEEMVEALLNNITKFDLPFEIICNVGIYVTRETQLSIYSMIDRAILAQTHIKGSYTEKYSYYTEAMRSSMISEQEITGMMRTALAEKQFVVYYQPQYNHSTGALIGAEALVRWKHPERGLISPGIFIPIFERNGFITKLDLHVFEETCIFIHKCMEKGRHIVPISSNFSRHDIFQEDFVECLEEIRSRYQVPAKYLRVEITESAIVGSNEQANEVIKKLHDHGYIVEMDDFGSGYSSLNVLKNIDLDVIKLDMLFLSDDADNKRGGTILSSVVRMAKWLKLPVIAEGVETVEQADFLRSIGCDYIQGYLYSKPLPEEKYEELLSGRSVGAAVPQLKLIDTLNAGDFWDPKSMETLIFSNYVGGAAIFDYYDGAVEVLRVNKKYLQEICMNQSEKELVESDAWAPFDEENKKIYIDMLERAIETEEEQECETWRTMCSAHCGQERICIRCSVRMIGKSDNSYLFFGMIRNITAEKNQYLKIADSERGFRMASEQVNIYYWEYTVSTREMRPCFRCMRDLGLPALLKNYPDSAIELGVFPPEVADMYRDWHRQIAEGVKELEAVIPLTAERIPFRVRYTTEFDESGRPVKAYGSAALVV